MNRPTFTGIYKFLTTRPNTRRLSKLDPEWLYVLPLQDIASASLYYTVYFDDGTDVLQNIDLGNLRQGEVKILDISYATVNYDSLIPAGASYIRKIDMYVGSIPSDTPSDLLTYLPYTPGLERQAFYYANSYGGFDTLVCTGAIEESIKSTQSVVNRHLPHDANLADSPQYAARDARGRRYFDINTGNMSRLEREALADMQIKKPIHAYKEISGTPVLLPCILENNSMVLPGTYTNTTPFDFSLSYAWQDRALDRRVNI